MARRKHRRGDVADIPVAFALYPGPVVLVLENQDVVAEQELRVDAGDEPRCVTDIGDRHAYARRPAGNEMLGIDLSLQPGVGEVRSKGVEAGVEGGQSGAFKLADRGPWQ